MFSQELWRTGGMFLKKLVENKSYKIGEGTFTINVKLSLKKLNIGCIIVLELTEKTLIVNCKLCPKSE